MGRKFLLGLVAGLLMAAPAAADTLRLDDPDVLRLLREVYPDLGADGKASQYKGVRVLPDTVDPEADKPATVDLDLAQSSASQTTLTSGSARYLVVLVDNVLVAAQIAPRYRLLDAVAVQTDPGGPPSVTDMFMIAADVPGMVVLNAHHNSQEGFTDYTLLGFVDGKLVPIYAGPSLYSVQYGDAVCDDKAVTQRLERLAPLSTRRDGVADLALKVVEEDECRAGKTTKSMKRVEAVLTWNAETRKYVGGEKELASLARRPQ
jgi:hypothetical protein